MITVGEIYIQFDNFFFFLSVPWRSVYATRELIAGEYV